MLLINVRVKKKNVHCNSKTFFIIQFTLYEINQAKILVNVLRFIKMFYHSGQDSSDPRFISQSVEDNLYHIVIIMRICNIWSYTVQAQHTSFPYTMYGALGEVILWAAAVQRLVLLMWSDCSTLHCWYSLIHLLKKIINMGLKTSTK